MKEGGPKGMGMEPLGGALHVSFPPLKPETTSLPRAETRHKKSMPIFADSGHMRSHGPPRHEGSYGSKLFAPMGGSSFGKPPVEYPRRTRPSNFQKWVKKYNGSRDPYDHLASFKQVVRAEQITDPHTHVEGIGLTLESKALSWF